MVYRASLGLLVAALSVSSATVDLSHFEIATKAEVVAFFGTFQYLKRTY